MALIKCDECGNEYSNKAPACPKCGNPTPKEVEEHVEKEAHEVVNIPEEEVKEEKHEHEPEHTHEEVHEHTHEETHEVAHEVVHEEHVAPAKKKFNNKLLIPIIGGAVALIVVIVIICVLAAKKSEENKAIRVDITMNSWYGDIEQILDDFGIEFYAVTGGANCYSGTKTNSFETEKYGILYTEFTYCKTGEVQRLRVYNKASDQPLRDPKPGEINTYNSYGYRQSSSGSGV